MATLDINLPVPSPLRLDESGTVRIGQTRVTLDTVVGEFEAGESPEHIAQDYPTITLTEVYCVIGFFLHHQEAVRAYLAEREQLAADVRQRLSALRQVSEEDFGAELRRRWGELQAARGAVALTEAGGHSAG